jgi:omega-6 fatty acid desaturase (delta-12 desaturase)
MPMPQHIEGPPSADSRWNAIVARYRQPVTRKGVWQVVNTAGPFVLLWVAMYFGLRLSYALTLALAVPTAFFLVRLFIIQHDCGHGAFFKSQRLNDALGSVIGVLTLTPYAYWRKTHALHHAGSGNLEHRGFGDIATLTVEEYRALSWWGRFRYRFYRHPAVLFLIGPVWQFVLWHRLPVIVPKTWRRERLSIVRNDIALATLVTAMTLVVGWKAFLLVQLPVSLLAGSVGVWLFYVQHQFEDTYWEHDERWAFVEAGLKGSSYYRLPRVLQWATGNIGLHHIHHLSSRIPNYRLQECFDENPDLQRVTTLTLWESIRCVRLALWDEAERRLVTFREARRRQ